VSVAMPGPPRRLLTRKSPARRRGRRGSKAPRGIGPPSRRPRAGA